jgi:RNA polymerase subunit RPABC4/transcription elongation factor Spt4
MAKEKAHKVTRELMTDKEINEKGMDKKEFSETWKGKIEIFNPEKSEVAIQLKVNKEGIYAIKI